MTIDLSFYCGIFVLPCDGSLYKSLEQRMGPVWPGQKLGMILHPDIKGVIRKFHCLHQRLVRACAADQHTRILELRAVDVVELISVPVTFVHQFAAIAFMQPGSGPDGTGIGARVFNSSYFSGGDE